MRLLLRIAKSKIPRSWLGKVSGSLIHFVPSFFDIYGKFVDGKLSFSARVHFDFHVSRPPFHVDSGGQCHPRALHLIFPRGIVASELYESLVRHAADSFRFTRFPNEARDYNKEANGGENVDEMTPRLSRDLMLVVKKSARNPSGSFWFRNTIWRGVLE